MKVAAKIKESADAARQISVDVMLIETVASNLTGSDPPVMPPDLLAETSAELSSISRSIRSAATSYGETVDEILKRIKLFIIAAVESSKSNWDKAREWNEDFWNSKYGDWYDKAVPVALRAMPGGGSAATLYGPNGPLDSSDVALGFSEAALGLGEVTWMLSSMGHDPAQQAKFEAMMEAIGEDPVMVLESLVGLDELAEVDWKAVARGEKDPALSKWTGGIAFDTTLGFATSGVGAAASRGGKVADAGSSAARRAWVRAAEKELAKVQGDLAHAKVATGAAKLDKFSTGIAEIYQRNFLEHVAGDNPFMPFRPDPDFSSAATKWSESVGAQSDAGRRLVAAQKAEQAVNQRLTVAEIEFRAAAQRLKASNVDVDGLRAALGNVNEVTRIVGMDIPLNRIEALLRAAGFGGSLVNEQHE